MPSTFYTSFNPNPWGVLTPLTRCRADRHLRLLRALTGLFGLLIVLSGCGGGPIVPTATGRFLYVATSSGIYGFSIMSTGTLSPLSTQPLVQNTGLFQIAATPGIPAGQSGPLLLGATGDSSVSVWTVGGGGSLTQTTPIGCSGSSGLGAITGLAVTSDSQYLVVVDGNSGGGSSSDNLGLISFSKTSSCETGYTSASTSTYPVQPAIDCAVSGTSPCILFLTVSTTSLSTSLNLETPQEIPVTLSSTTPFGSHSSSAYTCTPPNCPLGATFDPTTVFFYASFTGTNPPSLQSIAPQAKSAASQVSFPPTAPLNYPCVDTLGGIVYTPTSNGFLYASPTNSSGGLSGPTTVLSPSSLPVSLDMLSCAVVSNP